MPFNFWQNSNFQKWKRKLIEELEITVYISVNKTIDKLDQKLQNRNFTARQTSGLQHLLEFLVRQRETKIPRQDVVDWINETLFPKTIRRLMQQTLVEVKVELKEVMQAIRRLKNKANAASD